MATKSQLEQHLRNPNVRKFLDLLAHTEGTETYGYHTAFGGSKLSSLADHPRYLKKFTQTDGKVNKSSAAGRYQFLRKTWDSLAKRYDFKDFGPHNQDIAAVALLAQNGSLPHVVKGNFTMAVKKSGNTWASLPTSTHPQHTVSWGRVNKFLDGHTPKQNIPQETPAPQPTPAVPPAVMGTFATPQPSLMPDFGSTQTPNTQPPVPYSPTAPVPHTVDLFSSGGTGVGLGMDMMAILNDAQQQHIKPVQHLPNPVGVFGHPLQ